MKKILNSSLLRYIILGLFAVIIGLNVFRLNASRLGGDALPMPLGIGASVVLSGSMEPELSVGDLLIVVPRDDYQVGDVVVYQSGRTPVVHRIVAMDGEEITTRGDANNTNDNPISVKAIKGQVIVAIPLVGYGVSALKRPLAILILLALAVILVESSFRRGKTEQEAEKEQLKQQIRQLMEELKEN